MKVDIEKLKSIAGVARATSERQRKDNEIKEQERNERERQVIEQRAAAALGHVEPKLMNAANHGKTKAEIIVLEHEEYLTGDGVSNTATDRDRLSGAGLLVFDALVEAELTPTVEFWHDGMGKESHYFIQADFGE